MTDRPRELNFSSRREGLVCFSRSKTNTRSFALARLFDPELWTRGGGKYDDSIREQPVNRCTLAIFFSLLAECRSRTRRTVKGIPME